MSQTATPLQSHRRLWQYGLTAALLCWGFAVLVAGMEAMHMLPDEILTFGNIRYSFYESMLRLATRNNQAHGWWLQIWVWQRLVGSSEFAVRLHSALLSILTLATVYRIGRDWFGAARYGWFAIILLSVNSYFFTYALEMRMYALAMLTTVLSMRAFYGWLGKRSRQSAVFYGLSVTAMLYTHYYLAFVVLAQAAYFAVFHLLNWKLIKQGLLAASVALITWLPGIVILYYQLQFIGFANQGGLQIPTEPTDRETISQLLQVSSSGWIVLYGLLVLLGLLLLWRKAAYRLALFWLIIAPGLVLLVNLRTPIYTPRYTAYAAPAVGIIIGATLATIPLIWPRKRKVDVSIAHATSWIAVIVLAGISLYTLPNYLPVRVPLRHIYREMNQLSPAGTVLYTTHIDPDGTETDQMVRYLAPAIFENQAATLDEAIAARYVWFVTEHWFENATRVQFQQLAETHRVQQVVGDCKPEWCYLAQLMVAPPQREPTLFGDIIGFHGADVTITDKAIHALLWWSVNGQPTQDYSISLQLLDASGALVAQVDRQIKPPDFDHEIPTSQMQPDNSYIDARDLLLPDGLPAGEYMLQLVVYRWQDNTRLTLPDGRDTLPLQKVRIE